MKLNFVQNHHPLELPVLHGVHTLFLKLKTMTLKDFRIRGLCAAPFTPFVDGSGSSSTPADHVNRVDHKSIALHVEELLRQGVKYAFVCGTTGEGVTLSVTERQATLETWIKASRGRLSIIAHVGAESIADMLALAHHASGSGAVAIAAHTTTFNKPPTLDSTVELLALLSAAAPSLPLYFYYIAIKTGAALRCDKLLEAIHADPARVPTFRGVKFTDFDAYIYANCVAFADGAYDILSGRDEILLAALVMGGKGGFEVASLDVHRDAGVRPLTAVPVKLSGLIGCRTEKSLLSEILLHTRARRRRWIDVQLHGQSVQ